MFTHIKNFIKLLVIKFYAKLIIINLYFLNKSKKKIFHNHAAGFGDTYVYYISKYKDISKKNSYVLNLGYITNISSKFFFNKKKIINLIFYIYKFLPYYGIISEVRKSLEFKTKYYNNEKETNEYFKTFQIKNTINKKKIIVDKLKNHIINKELKEKLNAKYFCMYIKQNNNDKNDLSFTSTRQTANSKKVKKLIFYLIKKKFKVLLLGENNKKREKFLFYIKNSYLNKEFKNNIIFLCDLSKDYSFQDQVYSILHSQGFIGNSSGVSSLPYFLRKKTLLFDLSDNKLSRLYSHNRFYDNKWNRYIFKKIKIGKKIVNLNQSHINNYIYKNKRYDIKESSFFEIKKNLINFFSI